MKYSCHLFIFCAIVNFPSGMGRANPCATSIGSLIPGLIPIPHELPSGTNVCHRTCYDQSRCSYDVLDTFSGYPVLLFRCKCLGNCPPRKVLFGDYMSITCNNVTADPQSSRCTCGAFEDSFQCDFDVIEDPEDRPFYCACCSHGASIQTTPGHSTDCN